jgi:hypothetical protein
VANIASVNISRLPNKPLERAGVTRYGESSGWRAGRSAPGRYANLVTL